MGVPVDLSSVDRCLQLCTEYVGESGEHVAYHRSPGKTTPPISRDEILGLFSLKLLSPGQIKNWNFSPFPIPRFSALSLIKQLWEMRPRRASIHSANFFEFKHRNYFWQNNLDQLYRFAFSVPVQDRYFMLKTWNSFKWWNPAHILYLTIAKIDAKLSPSGIRWLKYCPQPPRTFKEADCRKAMTEEFPADHPIRVKLGI